MKPQHYQKRIKVHFGRVWHFCITNSPPRIYKTFYCFGQCGRAWREKNILILEVKRPVIKVSILLCWTHRRRVKKNLGDLGVTTFFPKRYVHAPKVDFWKTFTLLTSLVLKRQIQCYFHLINIRKN